MGDEEEKRGSKGASSGWYVGSRNSWPPLCLLQKEPWEIGLFQKGSHSYLCKQGDICDFIST